MNRLENTSVVTGCVVNECKYFLYVTLQEFYALFHGDGTVSTTFTGILFDFVSIL